MIKEQTTIYKTYT